MNIEEQYLKLLKNVLENGFDRPDRTGVGSRAIWGGMLTHDWSEGFPLITTKKMWFRGVVAEALWMISGADDTSFLEEQKAAHVWSPWAKKWSGGNKVGQIYGPSWRNWNDTGLDQLQTVIEQIKTNPTSRRHLIIAWNPDAIWNDKVCLPACHYSFGFQVENDKLNCAFVMRSSDFFIGAPWNIAFYGLIQAMVAQVCNLKPGKLIYQGFDIHLYSNHHEQAKEQLSREPKPLPKLVINPEVEEIDNFEMKDFGIEGYEFWPAIKAPIAV